MTDVIPWTCPHCKSRLGLDAQLRRHRICCPKCQRPSTVPDLDPELAKHAAWLTAEFFGTLVDLPERLGDALATACYRLVEHQASGELSVINQRAYKRFMERTGFFTAFVRHMPKMIEGLRMIERPRHARLYEEAVQDILDRTTHRMSPFALRLPATMRRPLKCFYPRMLQPIPGLAKAFSPEGEAPNR